MVKLSASVVLVASWRIPYNLGLYGELSDYGTAFAYDFLCIS